MAQTTVSFLNTLGNSLRALLAAAVMLAVLIVVAYAGLFAADAAQRAHIVLQGLGVTLLAICGGALALAVHHGFEAIEARFADLNTAVPAQAA
jgi:hypothetical protein